MSTHIDLPFKFIENLVDIDTQPLVCIQRFYLLKIILKKKVILK